MNRKAAFIGAVVSSVLFAFGCATEEAAKPPAPAPKAAPAPAAPAPEPTPTPRAATPAPKPEAKKPAVVNLASTELFEFNKATLTPAARDLLDKEVIAKLKDLGEIRYINVNGHADRLGTPQYNQKLSEKRAEAVRAYLVSRGADGGKIEVFGFGKTLPVKPCPDAKQRSAVIECLAPNRRVVVEIQGSPR